MTISPGAQAQDPAQMVLDVVVDHDDGVAILADVVDDDMGRRPAQRVGARSHSVLGASAESVTRTPT